MARQWWVLEGAHPGEAGGTAVAFSKTQEQAHAMEAPIITSELLRRLTDDHHLHVVRATDDRNETESPITAHEVEDIRDVMYRLWNAEHPHQA